jgi:hypothetical protein
MLPVRPIALQSNHLLAALAPELGEKTMKRLETIRRIGIDAKERAVLEKLPDPTLLKVVEVKQIFGRAARVIEHLRKEK